MPKLSDYVFGFVAAQGVRHVFLVTGGGAMHLNDSLSRCTEIEPVCNLQERASAIAAEHYGRATNRLGVAVVTTGPGATNAVTGVAAAKLNCTPCLFISGQVKRPDRAFDAGNRPRGPRQIGVQEVDIVSIVKPMTKYAVTVLDPQTIRYHLEKAVHLAQSEPRGPAWVDIPLDVQASPIDPNALKGFEADPLLRAILQEKSAEDLLVDGSIGAGFAIPGSIAACLAGDRKRTICVDDSAAFRLNVQELETVARLKLPIKFFVRANGGPDTSRVAAAYGLATAEIGDRSDLPRGVRRVLDMPGPVVCRT